MRRPVVLGACLALITLMGMAAAWGQAGSSDRFPTTAPATAVPRSSPSGIGVAILQSTVELGVERSAPTKLGLPLLMGGLGATVLLAAAVSRATANDRRFFSGRLASQRVPFQRGPPLRASA